MLRLCSSIAPWYSVTEDTVRISRKSRPSGFISVWLKCYTSTLQLFIPEHNVFAEVPSSLTIYDICSLLLTQSAVWLICWLAKSSKHLTKFNKATFFFPKTFFIRPKKNRNITGLQPTVHAVCRQDPILHISKSDQSPCCFKVGLYCQDYLMLVCMFLPQ